MKEAMWGVGFVILAIFGIFLISLFGNVTVTNQQDYTALKNTVEASMYDAIDTPGFVSGFCLCTNKSKDSKTGKWVFTSSNEYTIVRENIINNICPVLAGNKCEYIEGEYIINKAVFAETFVRRFSESVKGNTDYRIVIQDIIEYPPKVSVEIYSTNDNELDNGEYTIVNRIDAIIEADSTIVVNVEEPACYKRNNTFEWGLASEHDGWTLQENLDEESCHGTNTYTITVHHYVSNSSEKVHADDKITKKEGESYSTTYYTTDKLIDKYKNEKYKWDNNTPNNASGKVDGNITVNYYYKKDSNDNNSGRTQNENQCKWHYDSVTIVCKSKNPTGRNNFGGAIYEEKRVTITGGRNFTSCGEAYNACKSHCPAGYVYSTGCAGKQSWNVEYKDGSKTVTKSCYGGGYSPRTACTGDWTHCSCQG